MSIQGRWRIVTTPGYGMNLAGAHIQFDGEGGAFVIDCLTGAIHSTCESDDVEFDWQGNDEVEPASGDGWAGVGGEAGLPGWLAGLKRAR